MPTLFQGRYTGEFLLSEANGQLSRENIVVAMTGTKIESGTLMGKVTASGKYIPYLNAAADGSQAAAGVLFNTLNAATGDFKAVLIVRSAEVARNAMTGVDATGEADLKLLDIVLR